LAAFLALGAFGVGAAAATGAAATSAVLLEFRLKNDQVEAKLLIIW